MYGLFFLIISQISNQYALLADSEEADINNT